MKFVGWPNSDCQNDLAPNQHSILMIKSLYAIPNSARAFAGYEPSNFDYLLIVRPMEQCTLRNVNNYLNTNIYSYFETSGGQRSN
jgi:hypothetical protein